jgi:hypothetical protein
MHVCWAGGKTEVTAKAAVDAFDAVRRSYWETAEALDINKYKCAMLSLLLSCSVLIWLLWCKK